jgi:E3 ubiquitin-protein ligase MARCH6
LGFRFALAIGTWLFFVPLATTYSYLAWLYGPSVISKRATWDLVFSDAVSGAVVAGIIIISFLSLMSFADFLRFNIPQAGQPARPNRHTIDDAQNAPIADEEIDDVIMDHNHIVRRQANVNAVGVMDQRQPVMADNTGRRVQFQDEAALDNQAGIMQGMPNDPDAQREELQRRIRAAAVFQRQLDDLQHDRGIVDNVDEGPIPLQADDEARIAEFLRDMEDEEDAEHDIPLRRNNFEPQFEPLNQANADPGANQDDMELNFGLDEMLGLRGPISALVRNLLWFMAFVITYLGIFAFLPRFVGSSVYNRTMIKTIMLPAFVRDLTLFKVTLPVQDGIVQLVDELCTESDRLGRALKLNDIALLLVGYFSMALMILFIQFVVTTRKRMRAEFPAVVEPGDNQDGAEGVGGNGDEPPNAWEEVAMNENGDEIRLTLGQFFSMVMDCSSAFVKVGSLLFLKMFLLPLMLGIWLDIATLTAFGETPSSRIMYAGEDLFSSMLIHWVCGITFMLLVTVSVLQLREVVHPGLLARMIRPQEPQPDLLGNLLNESAATHTKRMVMSFGIYAFLLTIYIWLPGQILMLCGVDSYVPFLRPKLFYLLPSQLQVPLELLVFHLTMLGFLEKYKNSIGGMQHQWLTLVCKPLGLIDHVLPKEIDRFRYVGWKIIFLQHEDTEPDIMDDFSDSTPGLTDVTTATEAVMREEAKHNERATRAGNSFRNVQVDDFWYKLALLKYGVEVFIEEGITAVSPNEVPRYEPLHIKRNGKYTVRGCKEFIRLPLPEAEQDVADRRRRRPGANAPAEGEKKNLFSATLGPYRLRRNLRDDGTMVVEFWKECTGDLVDRPPEGWDDLGVGGAVVQGRWAWGKERKSSIEEGVAARSFFWGKGISRSQSTVLIFKVLFLLILSWFAVASLAITCLSAPVATGRFAMTLLRLPDNYLHDPIAFAIGLVALINIGAVVMRLQGKLRWPRSFRLPSWRKGAVVSLALVMWNLVIPLMLGFLYEVLVLKSTDWFAGEAPLLTSSSFLMNLSSGVLLLNVWAGLCIKSAFTKQFWLNVGMLAMEGEGDNADIPNADPPIDSSGLSPWQGYQHGRIALFFDVMKDALLCWEWDRVDPDLLLSQVVHPITVALSIVLAFPCVILAGLAVVVKYLELPEDSFVSDGTLRQLVFRAFSVVTIGMQCFIVFNEELKKWFKIVHKAARDDRYLVGEVLLDYSAH